MTSGVRKSYDDFVDLINEYGKNQYTILDKSDKFINTRSSLNIIHKKCNYIFSTSYKNIYDRKKIVCKRCKGIEPITFNKLKKSIEETNEYTVLSNLNDWKKNSNTTKVLVKHLVCGNEFYTSYSNFVGLKSRCRSCSQRKRHNSLITINDFKRIVKDKYGDEYTVISNEFKGKIKKLRIRHNSERCNFNEWMITPSHFIEQNCGCSICNKYPITVSTNNLTIMKILKDMNIKYISEYELCKNPKTGKWLIGDFYLEEYNLIIEYDGKQHFQKMFNDENKLNKQIERDIVKNDFLNKNDFNYIRIPYDVNKIDDIRLLLNFVIKTISSEGRFQKIIKPKTFNDYRKTHILCESSRVH